MSRIAIIDDNRDTRETFRLKLAKFIKRKQSTLEVIDAFPFKEPEEYFPWIESFGICALILDERLHNESEDGKGPVSYRGSDLVKRIRERFKDMPIFTLSSYVDDKDLMEEFSEFDYIIRKEDLSIQHADIILRASQRYLTENEKELSDYDELTRKVATGESNDKDYERLRALQTKLHIPLSDSLRDRNDWLDNYEEQVNSLSRIKEIP